MASEALLAKVKRKLRVTWSDVDTDARIEQDIIPLAEAEIRSRLGIPASTVVEWEQPAWAEECALLLNYCLYEWSDATDDFWLNYERDVAEVRRKWEVRQYAQEKASADA